MVRRGGFHGRRRGPGTPGVPVTPTPMPRTVRPVRGEPADEHGRASAGRLLARGRRPDPPAPSSAFLAVEAQIAGRLLVIGVAAVAFLWLLLRVEIVTVAAFLAFAQAAMLWPLARQLRRFLPGVVAAIICVTLWIAVLGALMWFISTRVIASWPQLGAAVTGGIGSLDDWAQQLDIPRDLIDQAIAAAQERASWAFSQLGTAAMSTLGALQTLLTILGVSLFATVFALTGGEKLEQQMVTAGPGDKQRQIDGAFRSAFVTARWWMWASTVTGLVDGLFIGLGLWILGVPMAAAIGALTFILGFIPMIGALLAGAVAVLVALFFGGLSSALWALAIVLLVQQIEGNVLSPLLMSRAMEFPPLVTLLLATAGGIAFGITGLFLAVPTAGILVSLRRGWRRADRHSDDVDGPRSGTPETSLPPG